MSLAVLPTSAKAESGGPSKARAHTPRAEFAPRPRGRVSPQSVSSVVRVCGRGGLLGPPRPCPEGPCPHPAAGAPAPQPALPSRPVGPCPEGTDTKVLSVLLTRLPKIVSLDVGNQYRWRIRYPSKTPGENPLALSWVRSVVLGNLPSKSTLPRQNARRKSPGVFLGSTSFLPRFYLNRSVKSVKTNC